QAKPETFDLRTRPGAEQTNSWLASRYRQQMGEGDVVYLWRAGDASERGVYGWGQITSNGPFIDERDNAYRVRVTYKKLFREPPSKQPFIGYRIFDDQPILRDVLVLRAPMGTNFPLTPEESNALRELITQTYGKDWAPPTAK